VNLPTGAWAGIRDFAAAGLSANQNVGQPCAGIRRTGMINCRAKAEIILPRIEMFAKTLIPDDPFKVR